MSFLTGTSWIEAPRGSFLRIPAGMTHDFANRGDPRAGRGAERRSSRAASRR